MYRIIAVLEYRSCRVITFSYQQLLRMHPPGCVVCILRCVIRHTYQVTVLIILVFL